MIPPIPIQPPIGGVEYGPVPIPPVIAPSASFLDDEDVVLPPPVEPPLPEDFEIVPGPAIVAPPSLPPEDEAPPLISLLGSIPPPAAGPDVTLAQGRDRILTLGQDRTAAEREQATAAEELRQAAGAYQSAKTPQEQQQALKRAEQAQQRIQGAGVAAQAAGLAMEREEAAQQAEVESALAAERTARFEEAAQVLDARAADTERRLAEAQAERQRAQDRRAAREQEYAALLDRGPQDQAATWTAAIGMIGEMWSAFAQRRQPNLMVWLDRGLQQAREKHAGELDAIKARIGAEEQAIGDVAVEVAQRQADDLAFEQSYLAKLDRDLALLAAQYNQTPQGMAADQARRQVAAQQQARGAEAQAAYDKAERERQKWMLEQRKLAADVAIAERKAQGGAGSAQQLAVREPTAVYVPNTDIKLADFKGQRDDVKRATAANAAVTDAYGFLQAINDYERMIEDYGKSGVLEKSNFTASAEYRELQAASDLAAVKLAKIIAGPGFSTTATDIETAKRLIQLPSNWWERADGARVAVAQLKSKSEDELRLRLNPYLETSAQERLIRQARARGVSRSDRQRTILANAEQILADPTADPATRIEAVDAVIEKAKGSAGGGASGAAWMPAAMQALRNAQAQLDAGQDDAPELERTITNRLEALRKQWRQVGTEGTRNQDRARLEQEAAAIGALPGGI